MPAMCQRSPRGDMSSGVSYPPVHVGSKGIHYVLPELPMLHH
jgi:hypothetical protein